MKIYDEHGAQVGELERPEPVEQDGVWYEAVAYRKPLPGENVYDLEEVHLLKSCSDRCREWVMRLIPTPTAEQLKAIGMKKRDDRPVEVKLNDMVWNGDGSYGNAMLGSCRWVLVPAEKSICAGCTTPATLCPSANDSKDRVIDCVCKNTRMPVAKEPAHTSPVGCEGCLHEKLSFLHSTCWNCQHEGDDIVPRKNYTPAPAPAPKGCANCGHGDKDKGCQSYVDCHCYDMWRPKPPAPKVTDAPALNIIEPDTAWKAVFDLCRELGMNGTEGGSGLSMTLNFIRSLARRAGEESFDPAFTGAEKSVREERERQNIKWGVQNHTPEWWLAILMEEVGELAQAILETHFDKNPEHLTKGGIVNIRKEAVQCAAVALAMIECIDRNDQVDDIKAVPKRKEGGR